MLYRVEEGGGAKLPYQGGGGKGYIIGKGGKCPLSPQCIRKEGDRREGV